MPWGRTWGEELIAEWLELEGFLTIIGMKAGTSRRGGRKEADVVGVRIEKDETLRIRHVEVGALYENRRKLVKDVERKFEPERVNYIKERLKSLLSYEARQIEYEKIYVLAYRRKDKGEIKRELSSKESSSDIALWDIDDLIEELNKSISEWIEKNRTPQNQNPALPESYWMLKLFQILRTYYARK